MGYNVGDIIDKRHLRENFNLQYLNECENENYLKVVKIDNNSIIVEKSTQSEYMKYYTKVIDLANKEAYRVSMDKLNNDEDKYNY